MTKKCLDIQSKPTPTVGLEPNNKRALERHKKFLEAAETLFLSQGYESTSVNQVVKVAGGSLVTLYRMFGNKLGLFEAVYRKKAMAFFNELEEGVVWSENVERSLYLFGKHLQSVMLSADGVAIYRLVLHENNDDQRAIQKIYFKYGPHIGIEMLGCYLSEQACLSKVKLIDAKVAAAQFVEMIKGPFMNRLWFGETITQAELDLALEQAVQIFSTGLVVGHR